MELIKIVKKDQLIDQEASLPTTFNHCDHAHVKIEEDMGTVVLETPFGLFTVCAIAFKGHGAEGGSLDVQYHGIEGVNPLKTKVLGFKIDKPTEVIREIDGFRLYAMDVRPDDK